MSGRVCLGTIGSEGLTDPNTHIIPNDDLIQDLPSVVGDDPANAIQFFRLEDELEAPSRWKHTKT